MSSGNLLISAEGKTIGIRFGFQALMGMSAYSVFDKDAVKTEDQQNFLTAATITKMAWQGYQNWCLYKQQDDMMTFQDFLDFMDVAYVENSGLFSDIWQAFNDSQAKRKSNTEDAEKKILTA
jgi:hypothetical protein